MPTGVRRSLSPEEHAIRVQFDAAQKGTELRGDLWRALQSARAKGARSKQRLVARLRFHERPASMASCVVGDLTIVAYDPNASRPSHGNRIDAYVSCELLFGTDAPPCERPGPCPHEIVVYVLDSDNNKTDLEKRAMDSLREMAQHPPKAP